MELAPAYADQTALSANPPSPMIWRIGCGDGSKKTLFWCKCLRMREHTVACISFSKKTCKIFQHDGRFSQP